MGDNPAYSAVGLNQAIFGGQRFAGRDRLCDLSLYACDVVRMDAAEKLLNRRPGPSPIRIDPVKRSKPRVGDHAIGNDIPIPGTDAVARRQRHLKALFVRANCGLGPDTFDMSPRPLRHLAHECDFAGGPDVRIFVMDGHEGGQPPFLDQRHADGRTDTDPLKR